MKKTLCLLTLVVFLIQTGFTQNSILGKWKSVNEDTGEVESIVEIYQHSQKIYGKILRIFPKKDENQDPVCDECDAQDPRYKKKIIGMEIIQDLEKDGNTYSGGNILDPKNGKVYRCKLWLESGNLMVRGYWGFFYRTQIWTREL